MNYNKIILEFLIDWLEWAEMEDTDERYEKDAGLCISLIVFIAENYTIKIYDKIEEIFDNMFITDGLDKHHPFGEESFITNAYNKTQHLDPTRITWVKQTITRLQEELSTV